MKRLGIGGFALGTCLLWTLLALSQTPGDKKGPGKKGGPPKKGFQLGWVLPPPLKKDLDLTPEQGQQLEALEREVRERLEKILTAEQRKRVGELGPPGAGGFKGPAKGRPVERPDHLKVEVGDLAKTLVRNPCFTEAGQDGKSPAHYVLAGNVEWVHTGKANEFSDRGVALRPGGAGSVAQNVSGFPGGVGKWYRFSIRGLPENQFAVPATGLFMKVDFFAKQGTLARDGVTRQLYPLVERDRKELAVNGHYGKGGAAVWKTYTLDFRLPFAGIDQLRLSVGVQGGTATTAKDAAFFVTEFALTPIPDPTVAPKLVKGNKGPEPALKSLIHLGGRWYYDPEPGMKEKPSRLVVTAKNAHRLYYRDNRLTNPFAENMTAWLRKGYLDIHGKLVTEDRMVADNLVVVFEDDRTMIVHARNLPNHPTAQFPERGGKKGNPSYIQEHDYTYYIPLNPVRNPKAVAMDKHNSNRALPMGAIGIAINGVVFYNPFDAGMVDATDFMDRCCGHPSPDNRYHYHKYPICVKSPFVDEGEEHSPLIGFAFDGFPIYGPYEAKGVMAMDSKVNPLNEFNVHYDEERGWHNQVTPGRFPYVIGGYWGVVDARNFRGKGGPKK